MKPEIITAIITSISSLLVAIVSIVMNNRLLGYKVDELTKKVEKHNQIVERVALLEQENGTQWKRIDDIKVTLEKLREEIGK